LLPNYHFEAASSGPNPRHRAYCLTYLIRVAWQ
jgi:hypothetical protein